MTQNQDMPKNEERPGMMFGEGAAKAGDVFGKAMAFLPSVEEIGVHSAIQGAILVAAAGASLSLPEVPGSGMSREVFLDHCQRAYDAYKAYEEGFMARQRDVLETLFGISEPSN